MILEIKYFFAEEESDAGQQRFLFHVMVSMEWTLFAEMLNPKSFTIGEPSAAKIKRIDMLCPICYPVLFAGNVLEKCFRKGGMKNFHGVNHRRTKNPKIKKKKKKKEEKRRKKKKNLESFFYFSRVPPPCRFSWIANRT